MQVRTARSYSEEVCGDSLHPSSATSEGRVYPCVHDVLSTRSERARENAKGQNVGVDALRCHIQVFRRLKNTGCRHDLTLHISN